MADIDTAIQGPSCDDQRTRIWTEASLYSTGRHPTSYLCLCIYTTRADCGCEYQSRTGRKLDADQYVVDLNVCACVCVRVHMSVCTYVCVRVYVCVCICLYVRMHVCMHECMYEWMDGRMYVVEANTEHIPPGLSLLARAG